MSHEQGHTSISLFVGGVFALLADAAEGLHASSWAGGLLHTLCIGALGGIGAFLAKKLMEWIERRITKRTNNKG